MHIIRYPWKLYLNLVILAGFDEACQGMSTVLQNNKATISLGRVELFCLFDACSFTSIEAMLFWAGIVRHGLSANQIVKCFKLKKLKNDMRYQVDFLLQLKLEEILCYFGLWPQTTLGQSVCRIFYFWLVWLVKLNTGGPLLHYTYLFL